MASKKLRRVAGILRNGRAWRADHSRLLLRQVVYRQRNAAAGLSDRDHLEAAAAWLARAQDVEQDGGVCGRYLLRTGWTSSYPETTGYIIPTFLALEKEAGLSGFRDRARRALDFLLGLQLADGGFPGGEVHENTARPSAFNTAQIINGLTAWHKATQERRSLDAARRAGDWLVSIQEPDGAWRAHVYGGVATTYTAHASCWLAQLGERLQAENYLASARAHLEWVLGHVDPRTGWFDLCGFNALEHRERIASTHTIAYTLWGTLLASEILDVAEGHEAVERAAWSIARKLELWRWMPGVLDHNWRRRSDHACLTGNAQLAAIWLRLFERSGDARYLNAALQAIDLVKLAQPMESASVDIRGAIPGSDPIWGGYITMGLPNWAAKFFIDALLAKARTAGSFGSRELWSVPADVPRAIPSGRGREPSSLRTVLLASPRSLKVEQMVAAWAAWGFKPDAVVIENRASTPWGERLRQAVRDRGMRALSASLWRRLGLNSGDQRSGAPTTENSAADPNSFCQRQGIPVVQVDSLDSESGVAAVRELSPDLAVHAGAGILRDAILRVPRLGTLNAHSGLLPKYRGMNVAEWAALAGEPVGCSVHFIDPGIDTGPIVVVREVDISGAKTIADLRRRVDQEQIALLGEAVRFVLSTGQRPPTRSQTPEEGKQFFRMHPELQEILQAKLAGSASRHPPTRE